MGEGVHGLAAAYQYLFTAALIFLAILLVLCLIRAIIGPRVADRLVAVNMIGTMVMVIIAILTLMLQEGYLADICLIYAMISFLAVIVLTKVYMGVYLARKDHMETEAQGVHSSESVTGETSGVHSAEGGMGKAADVSQIKDTVVQRAGKEEKTDGGI